MGLIVYERYFLKDQKRKLLVNRHGKLNSVRHRRFPAGGASGRAAGLFGVLWRSGFGHVQRAGLGRGGFAGRGRDGARRHNDILCLYREKISN